jgi:ligand-binding SRPBCC domain-containing protein
MIAFQTSIAIERPLEEVFAFVSDPGNFSSWNSAVRDVRPTSAAANGPNATYVMTRQLPTGAATNQLEIVAREQAHEFAIRTTNGPTPFLYRYRFAVENGKTIVQLDAQVELDGIGAFMPQLARRAVKHGVDDNLATLKLILEERRPRNPR